MTRKKFELPLHEVLNDFDSNAVAQPPRKLKAEDEENKENTYLRRQHRLQSQGPHDVLNDRTQSIVPYPPAASILRLPIEILRMICEELPEDDIPSLRLQCKHLCEVASPHFLHQKDIVFKKSSIDSLLQLSKHPSLSSNVETIIYTPNMLRREPRPKWEEQGKRLEYSLSEIPPPPKQSAPERDWRLFHRNLRKACRQEEKRLSVEELEIAWDIYQRYLREQDEMIAQDYASQELCQAFRNLSNLSELYVNYGWGLWPGDPSVNSYRDGLCKAGGGDVDEDGSPRGLKQAMSLLSMLGDVDLHLIGFGIGSLNWRFFKNLCDNDGDSAFFGKMKTLVESLKDLELVITTWSDTISDEFEDYEDEGEEVRECRAFLGRGVLGRLVAAAPNLRRLAIGFDADEFVCPLDFKHLVLGTHWSYLSTLELQSIDVQKDDWTKFFERHASTIKHLSLGRIRLLEGEWSEVLECMQTILALHEMVFNDHLYGNNPHQYWDLAPTGYTSSKDDSVPGNRLRWALQNFMVHGGVCPLLNH